MFNNKKVCDDCGQCDVCDLDNKKVCNSCGKCLEIEGVDIRAVKIDEISEVEEKNDLPVSETSDKLDELTEETFEEYDDSYFKEHSDEFLENEEVWELIDDIDGLSEILEPDSKSDIAEELYPGLVYIKK
jgi:Fe-S-cluster containining protein